ncbi:MAG TPA: phosphoketolase family protein, partial [Candidatus Binatia bacterium]|nr:phosphoketolase family protein [Candidatus Binatia bacterium]
GAVLPILHLNGWKIAGPTVLGRQTDETVAHLLAGHGYEAHFVEGDDPMTVHGAFAATLDACWHRIQTIQAGARGHTPPAVPPRWPAIVLRTPKGWTGPHEVDGVQVEGTFRAHQVPLANVRENPKHLAMLEAWMRSYKPEELFDAQGHLVPEIAAIAPRGDRRMGANPHANGGRLLADLDLPAYTDYARPVPSPAVELLESTRALGEFMRDIYRRNPTTFRLYCPDETSSNRLGAVFEIENRCFVGPHLDTDDHISPDGRVMEVLSEHNCHGWLEGYLLTGRHGLFATYEAFAMVSASMTIQHAKWLEEGVKLEWRAPISSFNVLLTSTCWRNDHNGFSHQGPGLIDTVLSKKGTVARIYLPPDANTLLSVADHCFRSRDYVNLIVIDKQPQLQWLDMAAAREHCARGASRWAWASSDGDGLPDVVMGSAGDVPTLETIAAVWLLRRHLPGLKVRMVNVVDLMVLSPPDRHPHGMPEGDFDALFTRDRPVIFAFHGYQGAIHQVVHGRPDTDRFHVRGFNEEGTTTTPFDMVVRNGMSRYHLCKEVVRRVPDLGAAGQALVALCDDALARHERWVCEHLEDMPEVRDWTWTAA